MWLHSIYKVMSTTGKDVWINLRVNPRVREEFKAAADMRGGSMSSLLHQYMIKVIREEKDKNPADFAAALEGIRASDKAEGGRKLPKHPAVVEDAEDESVLFETTQQLTGKPAAKKSVPTAKRSDKSSPKKARR